MSQLGETNPIDQVQDMINKNVIQSGTRVILAFASFNFDSTDYIPGIDDGLSMSDIQQIVNNVHSHGGKISLL